MNYSILKSGSLIKAGSKLNDVTYNSDTTLSSDLKIQPITLNTFQSNYTGSKINQALNFILTQVAVPFSTSSTYVVDDFVVYNGLLYQCTTAVTTAGEWDASKWQVQKIFDNNGYVIVQGGNAPAAPAPTKISVVWDGDKTGKTVIDSLMIVQASTTLPSNINNLIGSLMYCNVERSSSATEKFIASIISVESASSLLGEEFADAYFLKPEEAETFVVVFMSDVTSTTYGNIPAGIYFKADGNRGDDTYAFASGLVYNSTGGSVAFNNNITWDGDDTGKEKVTIDEGLYLVNISNLIPTSTSLSNCLTGISEFGPTQLAIDIADETTVAFTGTHAYLNTVFVVVKSPGVYKDWTFNTAGVYVWSDGEGAYVNKISWD